MYSPLLDRSLGDLALGEALVDALGDASRDGSTDLVNITALEDLAESSINDVVAESKGLIGDLAGAKILRRERRDEGSVGAVRVVLTGFLISLSSSMLEVTQLT
jgi:hypothetical protein